MTDFLHTFALILYLTGWVQWARVAHRARDDDGGWWLLLAAGGVIWPVIVAEQAAEQMLRSDDQ